MISHKEVRMAQWGKTIKLSDRQLRIMRYVQNYHQEKGMPTTYGEIGEGLGIVKSQVWKEIQRLKALRLLTFEEGRARTLKITECGETYLEAQNEMA